MKVFFLYSITWTFVLAFPFKRCFPSVYFNKNYQAYVEQKLSDEINQDKSRRVADKFIGIPSLFILL
jgi:hypothetical protein